MGRANEFHPRLDDGFGEEIFFRGYIQSRVDQAFGLPFRLLGFEFGPGLLVSSLSSPGCFMDV
jgi:hypothetical protein